MDKDDRSVRIAAGEALAVIFEVGDFERFFSEKNGSSDSTDKDTRDGYVHLKGLRGKVLNQVKDLASEAGGKGTAKKDLNVQRNLFRDLLDYLEVLHISNCYLLPLFGILLQRIFNFCTSDIPYFDHILLIAYENVS